RLHHVEGQAVVRGEGSGGRAFPAEQAAGRSNPETLTAIFVKGAHRGIIRHSNEPPVLKPGQPAIPTPGPNTVLLIHQHRPDARRVTFRPDSKSLELAVLPTTDAVLVRADPEPTLLVLGHRFDH